MSGTRTYGKRDYRKKRTIFTEIQGITPSHKVLLILCAAFFIGVCAGAVYANKSGVDYQIADHILNSITEVNKSAVFVECLIKYGIIALVLWVLSFVPIGSLFIILIIGFKGMSVGFTSSFFTLEFGVRGLLYGLLMYLPQSILLMSAYFLVAYFGIHYILENVIGDKKNISTHRDNLVEFFLVLVISMGLILAASFFEGYILPSVLTNILFSA